MVQAWLVHKSSQQARQLCQHATVHDMLESTSRAPPPAPGLLCQALGVRQASCMHYGMPQGVPGRQGCSGLVLPSCCCGGCHGGGLPPEGLALLVHALLQVSHHAHVALCQLLQTQVK